MLNLTFLALRCSDVETCRTFYDFLGMKFGPKHRHGNGPDHYACESMGSIVFELYPKKAADTLDQTAIGLATNDLPAIIERLRSAGIDFRETGEAAGDAGIILRDPDGRRVQVNTA